MNLYMIKIKNQVYSFWDTMWRQPATFCTI